MMSGKKRAGKAMSMPAGIALGLALGVVITLVGAASTAWLVVSGKTGESTIGYGAMITLVLAAFGGSFLAQRSIKHRKFIVSCITGACYYLFLICMTLVFFHGQFQGVGIAAVMVLAGTACAALLAIYENRPGKKRRKIPVYR